MRMILVQENGSDGAVLSERVLEEAILYRIGEEIAIEGRSHRYRVLDTSTVNGGRAGTVIEVRLTHVIPGSESRDTTSQ